MTRDELLDELFDRLAGTGAPGRRALTEAEEHLAEAIEDGRAQGLSHTEAEAAAVARFGPPAEFAAGIRSAHGELGSVLRPVFIGTWVAGIVIALAVGVCGLALEAMGRWAGPVLVAGDRFGVTYTPARCAQYLALYPDSVDCGQAAARDHWGELVLGRVGAGVLGLVALVAFSIARRTVLRGPAWRTPAPVVAAVLVVGFLGAASILGLPEMAVGLTQTTAGTGAGLVDGSVSVLAAASVAVWLRYSRAATATSGLSVNSPSMPRA